MSAIVCVSVPVVAFPTGTVGAGFKAQSRVKLYNYFHMSLAGENINYKLNISLYNNYELFQTLPVSIPIKNKGIDLIKKFTL